MERRVVMAKTPSSSVAGDPNPESRGTGQHAQHISTLVNLTASAERYAIKHGMRDRAKQLTMPVFCSQGDIVSLEENGARHDFFVIRRRWIIGNDAVQLEVTLDHPARHG